MSDPLSEARRQLAEWDDWLAGVGYDERTPAGRAMVAPAFAAAIKHLRAALAEVDRLTGERDELDAALTAACRDRDGIAEDGRRLMGERDQARALLDDVMCCLRWSTERDSIVDNTYEPLVESICQGAGYGALMDSAQRCWRRSAQRRGDPLGGEHIAGPCRATVDRWLKLYDALPGAKPPDGNGAHGVIVQLAGGSDE